MSRIIYYFALLIILCFPLFSVFAAPGPPSIISYQGRLTDADGNLLGSFGTTFYFKFSIWDSPTVGLGTKLWPSSDPSSVSATVRQGVFNVNIGDTANGYPDPLTYNFNTNQDIYLEVRVSSTNTDSAFQTLSPRQRISASAFAQLAGAVSGTTTPSSFGTTTPIANSIVTIEATSTSAIPLSLRAIVNQIANLFQIQNSSGSNLFYSNANGGLFASSTLQVSGVTTLYGNLGVGTTSPSSSLSVQGNGLFSGNLAVAGLTATGTITFSNLSTGCAQFSLTGVLTSTGSACGGGVAEAAGRSFTEQFITPRLQTKY